MKRFAGTLLAVFLAATTAPAGAQELRTYTSSRQLGDQEALDVRVTYGAGRFIVGAAPAGLLYRMSLRYDEELFEPVADFDGESLHLGVDSGDGHVRMGKQEGGELRVELARSVPTELTLEFGAGRANVDLGGLSLTDLEVHAGAAEATLDVSRANPTQMARAQLHVGAADFTARRLGNLNARRIEVNAGVGDITIDLTGEWQQDGAVQINMGLGSLQLRLPEGIGVKLQEKTFLTSVDTQGLVKRGDAYYSLDWDKAERQITVEIQAAFGSVDVRWSP
jgi:hypothetical protein